ncbi:MAG: hemerythrin domain-containing protein [Proteobacteria bacterium]|nr:hemerythrin domain-containing protein [Pseudomonadota bacterium]
MSDAAVHKSRPVRSPAPALPSFESLDRTHAQVLQVLKQFDQLLQHLDDNGADSVAQASAQAIHDFFTGSARQHHADEERLVFPGLLASGDAEMVQHVKRLQQDHGWLEEDWLELAPQIEAIATGYNWYDTSVLRHALPIFTALYEEHIGLEESLIYPEAKRRQQALADGARQRTA